MPSSLAEVRAALADALSDIDGLNVLAHAPDQPPVPCAYLLRSGGQARTDFGKTSPSYDFIVRVVVSRADIESAQAALDAHVERGTDQSVWDALEADPTCGGVLLTLRCNEVSGDQVIAFGDVGYLSADFALTVYPA
jgi:hypothetical protein